MADPPFRAGQFIWSGEFLYMALDNERFAVIFRKTKDSHPRSPGRVFGTTKAPIGGVVVDVDFDASEFEG